MSKTSNKRGYVQYPHFTMLEETFNSKGFLLTMVGGEGVTARGQVLRMSAYYVHPTHSRGASGTARIPSNPSVTAPKMRAYKYRTQRDGLTVIFCHTNTESTHEKRTKHVERATTEKKRRASLACGRN